MRNLPLAPAHRHRAGPVLVDESQPKVLPSSLRNPPDRGLVDSVSGAPVELGPQLEPGAAVEHRVVGDERDAPADRCGRDPQVGVVASLVQAVPDLPAFVSQLSDGLDRVDVNRQDTCSRDQT